ncbi:hypothetical protein J6590_067632 [Homalodisca vitripennis]|nr:hypothetical protein J6590_067632 [Homalodisca vitripennis]
MNPSDDLAQESEISDSKLNMTYQHYYLVSISVSYQESIAHYCAESLRKCLLLSLSL